MPLIVAIIVGRVVWVIYQRNLTDYDRKFTDDEFFAGFLSFMLGLLASILIVPFLTSNIKIGYTQNGEYDLLAISSDNKFIMYDIDGNNFNFVYDDNGTPTHISTTKTNRIIRIHQIKETEVGYVNISKEYKYNTLYTHLLLFPYSLIWDISPEEKMIYDVHINPANILITKEEASN